MTVARIDGVAVPGPILEPASPLGQVGAVLGMASPVLGLDHPEGHCCVDGSSAAGYPASAKLAVQITSASSSNAAASVSPGRASTPSS